MEEVREESNQFTDRTDSFPKFTVQSPMTPTLDLQHPYQMRNSEERLSANAVIYENLDRQEAVRSSGGDGGYGITSPLNPPHGRLIPSGGPLGISAE